MLKINTAAGKARNKHQGKNWCVVFWTLL